MNLPETLIINSYGGSLTIATKQEQHPVIASMEDDNFGVASQVLNFPDLRYYRTLSDWPLDIDLKDKIVICHPPCAAFSSNNRSRALNKRGATSDAFACTTRILDYVLPRWPAAVAIESVPGALDGARHVHDRYANEWGYRPYRILQNAASFGVAQWRRRFWLVLTRQDSFTCRVKHDIKHVRDVIPSDGETGDCLDSHVKRMESQWVAWKKMGLTEDNVRYMLATNYGGLIRTTIKELGIKDDWHLKAKTGDPIDPLSYERMCDAVVGARFSCGSLHSLNPDGFAPVLLGTSWWWYANRMLGFQDYKKLMGFPAGYRFHDPRLTLILLSKGVCPPVARWVLRQIRENVYGFKPDNVAWDIEQPMTPGDVADLRLDNKHNPNFGPAIRRERECLQ